MKEAVLWIELQCVDFIQHFTLSLQIDFPISNGSYRKESLTE